MKTEIESFVKRSIATPINLIKREKGVFNKEKAIFQSLSPSILLGNDQTF